MDPEVARLAKLAEEEAAREAEREKLWQEREAQRQDEQEIRGSSGSNSARLREQERKKKEKIKAERKKMDLLLENAFDGEVEEAWRAAWVEECFGATLIGAKVDCEDKNKHTALSEAACGGHANVCKLLLDHGANVNSVNVQGRTPLFRAAFMDKRECVKLLLENGGDPRSRPPPTKRR